MLRHPSEWTTRDCVLVAHALLRTRWQDDLDDQHALELAREIAASKDVPLRDLLECGRAPNNVDLSRFE